MDKLTQTEFDELDAIVIHLRIDDREPARTLCSGEVFDPNRWIDFPKKRKFCQACSLAAKRLANRVTPDSSV